MSDKKFFVEIGSCDFDTLIPLAQQGWEGIIVEPVKYYLDKLERIPGVAYENLAITQCEGLYKMKYWDPGIIERHGEKWMHGSGNLNVGWNIFNANPGWEKHEITIEIPGITLGQLFEKHQVTKVDFMKIDTEGFEGLILSNYDWKIKPSCIRVEFIHSGEQALRNILEKQGYLVYKEINDLYAIG